jgi:cytochrome d ubiquinol oxidase subunit I
LTNLGLARFQFGATLLYHFLFVPLTIGLGLLIAILETFYYFSHHGVYKTAIQFWIKIYLVNFSVGVVTGIIQEFQFGTNWADFSRFVGDVFGAPLAIETLMAFFLESTFLGAWIFGWERLSPKVHLFAIWMVAIGSAVSAFWILAANSFMQEPVGFALRHGKAEMVNFWAVLANPQLWLEFPHTLFGAIATGSVFMVAISAYHLLRHTNDSVFGPSYRIGMVGAVIGSVLVFILGHEQAQHLIVAQPMKMAASEALWHTSPIHAPWTVIGYISVLHQHNPFVIKIPYFLSILAYNSLSGRVLGLLELNHYYQHLYGPGNYIPPINPTFWAFRTMIFAGTLILLIALAGGYNIFNGKRPHWFLVLMEWALILPYLSNTAG